MIPNVIMAVYFRELVLSETSEVIRSFWKGVLFLLIPSFYFDDWNQWFPMELNFLRPINRLCLCFPDPSLEYPDLLCRSFDNTDARGSGSEKNLSSIMFSGALINIILNYYFIPIFHLSGAAYATLITEGFILIMTGVFSVILIYKPRTLA